MMKQMEYKTEIEKKVLHEGTHDGYDFLILSLGSHPTAYVKVPKEHKYFEKDYEDIDIDTHGGLTYSNFGVIHREDGWWIGWDYAHAGDYLEYVCDVSFKGKMWSTEEIFEHVKHVINQLKGEQ